MNDKPMQFDMFAEQTTAEYQALLDRVAALEEENEQLSWQVQWLAEELQKHGVEAYDLI